MNRLKGYAGGLLWFVFYTSIFVAFMLFIHWLANLAGRFHEEISVGFFLIFAAQLLFVLLSLFPARRGLASKGIATLSVFFGLLVWLRALLLAYALWGLTAVIIGLLFFGVGVLPVAMLACLFKAQWGILVELIVLTIMLIGSRFFAGWCAGSAEYYESQHQFDA